MAKVVPKVYPIILTPNIMGKIFEKVAFEVNVEAHEIARDLVEQGAEYANTLYSQAEYDGEHDALAVVRRSSDGYYAVQATGKSVGFIEFGTGVRSTAPGSEGKDVWRFSANGRKIKLTAGGHNAKYKTGGYERERFYYTGPKKHKRVYIDPFKRSENDSEAVKFDKQGNPVSVRGRGLGIRTVVDKHGNVTIKNVGVKSYRIKSTIQAKPEKIKTSKNSYITNGNKPNLVMKQTAKYIFKSAPEVVRKHLK